MDKIFVNINFNNSYGWNIYMCPPTKSTCWNPIPHCKGFKRWDLWEVVKINWILEGGLLITGFKALLRITKAFASSFSAIWEHKEKLAACRQEGGSHQNPSTLTPWFQTPRLQNCEKYISVVYKSLLTYRSTIYCCL